MLQTRPVATSADPAWRNTTGRSQSSRLSYSTQAVPRQGTQKYGALQESGPVQGAEGGGLAAEGAALVHLRGARRAQHVAAGHHDRVALVGEAHAALPGKPRLLLVLGRAVHLLHSPGGGSQLAIRRDLSPTQFTGLHDDACPLAVTERSSCTRGIRNLPHALYRTSPGEKGDSLS